MSTIALVTETLRGRIAAAIAPASVVVRRARDFDSDDAGVCLFLHRVSHAQAGREQRGLALVLHYAILFGGESESYDPERLVEAGALALHADPVLTLDAHTLRVVPAALTADETVQLAGKRGLLTGAWDVVGLVLPHAP